MTGLLSTRGTSEMPWEPDTSLLDAARQIAPMIREHSEEAERERRLSQPVLEALRETGLLRMTTPRSLGGLETDPITRALVGEEIGRHDSAAAWTLENPLDWAFFCCRLPESRSPFGERLFASSGRDDVLRFEVRKKRQVCVRQAANDCEVNVLGAQRRPHEA